MKVEGKIKQIMATVEVSEKFKKRDIAVTTSETFPQTILIQFSQDKCAILDKYKVGQDVSVSINLKGREWTNPEGVVKYFNTIEGWRIEEAGAQQAAPSPNTTIATSTEDAGDLPF